MFSSSVFDFREMAGGDVLNQWCPGRGVVGMRLLGEHLFITSRQCFGIA